MAGMNTETCRVRFEAARHELLAAMEASNADVTGIRPPADDRVAEVDELLARLADVRGRGAFYPSIRSGRGRGALVELADGSVTWDMICGIAVRAAMRCFVGREDGGGIVVPDRVAEVLGVQVGDEVGLSRLSPGAPS